MNRKTGILALLLILTVISPGIGQQTEEIKPDKQLKGGIVTSRLAGTEWSSTASPGFAIGISLDFRFSQLFSVQPELYYVEKGGREAVDELNTEFDLALDYVEVPLLAKFHLPASGMIRPHAYLGPYAGFLIQNSSNIEVMDARVSTPDKLIEDAATSDFGATLGAGAYMLFPFNTMSIEVRYSRGFTDAFAGSENSSSTNSTVMFMVGFRF
ncbi:MAG: porin family protein [Balneolaceae bacterium]|nr:porin family protein [Balneolaceae bacterium]